MFLFALSIFFLFAPNIWLYGVPYETLHGAERSVAFSIRLFSRLFFAATSILLVMRTVVYFYRERFKRKIYAGCLGEDEKEILRFYFIKKVRSQPVDESSGAAELLIKHKILRIATNVPLICGASGFFNTLIICDWAWKYFKKHQNLIDIEKGIDEVYPVD